MRLRGRKGIRESLEQQPDLVILDPKQHKGRWMDFFGNNHPIYVELGMGKGRFISEMSALYPELNFIGVDMYDELVRRASDKARAVWHEKASITSSNLALALLNIEYIDDVFASGEITRIFLNFSDPWPKQRHAFRRLTHPRFLNKYKHLLSEWGEIHVKTDSPLLFEFSLNSFSDMGLRMRNISLHLHRDGVCPDYVMTEYEMKFVEQGVNIFRCEAVAGQKALQEHIQKKERALTLL